MEAQITDHTLTPVRAIRYKCLECNCGSRSDFSVNLGHEADGFGLVYKDLLIMLGFCKEEG